MLDVIPEDVCCGLSLARESSAGRLGESWTCSRCERVWKPKHQIATEIDGLVTTVRIWEVVEWIIEE